LLHIFRFHGFASDIAEVQEFPVLMDLPELQFEIAIDVADRLFVARFHGFEFRLKHRDLHVALDNFETGID